MKVSQIIKYSLPSNKNHPSLKLNTNVNLGHINRCITITLD